MSREPIPLWDATEPGQLTYRFNVVMVIVYTGYSTVVGVSQGISTTCLEFEMNFAGR